MIDYKSRRAQIALSIAILSSSYGFYNAAFGEVLVKNITSMTTKTDSQSSSDKQGDTYSWLEEVESKKALDWANAHNDVSVGKLKADPQFEVLRKRFLDILESKDKIPYIAKHGDHYYNFWRDEKNTRGLIRRTTLEEYKKKEPKWETVLDIDKLAADEKENWVYSSSHILEPDEDRVLISLSRGGGDAVVVREFDYNKLEFVKDGFNLPEGKHNIAWRNRDSIYVGTDFGPGSMTSSGYPRIVKQWDRGTKLADAKQIFEGKESDVSVAGSFDYAHGHNYDTVGRSMTFFSDNMFSRTGDKLTKIDKPDDADQSNIDNLIGFRLRTDWSVGGKTYPAGSYIAMDHKKFMAGDRNFFYLFEPTERSSFAGLEDTKNNLLLTEHHNVRSKAYILQQKEGKWSREKLDTPAFGDVTIWARDTNHSDDYFLQTNNYLTPETLYLCTPGKTEREKLKEQPAFFNTDGLEITQNEATSKDGTKIPYFQVARKGLKLDGTNPTILYGYGGFEVPLLPDYNPAVGAGWLEKGGVYVVANIRGGGEFGPKWHEAALKGNRQRAYEDFISVAEDLISRKVTSPPHLGANGASNGGLLMGVMLTQRPDLFGAIDCGSPLLDMHRFSHLLAGASWMGEYGDPDKPEEWAYISKYSPYQNLKSGVKYPPILVTTSTRDDRVHPGHARKFVAKLEELGQPVLYYENTEGGHSAAANNKQRAFMQALTYTFFADKLGLNEKK